MADDADDGAEDERTIELSAIGAIYPELSLDPLNPFSANIDVPVEPQQPLLLRFDGTGPAHSVSLAGDLAQETRDLSYLPPLRLRITLPDGYPNKSPPQFEIRSSWLPAMKLEDLAKAGTRIWEDMGREQVVFAYIDYLRDGADNVFGLVSNTRILLGIPLELKVSLLDFDLKAKRAKFEQQTFQCGICLEPKRGSACHRLVLCSHVFCVDCLQDFYNNCITEGDIDNVKCMAPDCGEEHRKNKRKKDRTLGPSELLQIPLHQDTVERYIKLKRKKRLESDRTTIYCPRKWCQGPARSKKASFSSATLDSDSVSGSDDEEQGPAEPETYDRNAPETLPPPADRLAICEDCTFAFCKVCKASWHGEYYACFPRSHFELTAEERASEAYLKSHTQLCPTCDAPAQKSHGCNHMICFKCRTHFCYLCGAWLQKDNPYQHYNTPNKGCYMRLWELEAGDGGANDDIFRAEGVDIVLDEGNEGLVGDAGDGDGVDEEDGAGPAAALPPAPAVPVIHNPPANRHRAGRGPLLRAGGQHQPRQNNADAALQHFLQLVENDEEDEWDSDEMEDEAEGLGDRWIG